MRDARREFDRMKLYSVVSWTALLSGYAGNGEESLALEIYFRMLEIQDLEPNSQTFLAALKACCGLADTEQGRVVKGKVIKPVSLAKGMLVHSEAAKRGCETEIFVASTLVNMYIKCGSVEEAQRIFEKMPCRTEVSFNLLMLGYAEAFEGDAALSLLARMQREGHKPNGQTYVAALKACICLAEREDDRKVLKLESLQKVAALERMSEACKDAFLLNTLLDAYAKCGSMVDARRVFDRMPAHSIISWTALILGYAENGEGEVALRMFGFLPPSAANALTYVAALKACSSMDVSEEHGEARGIKVHAQAAEFGFDTDILVASSLMDMYSKCGSTSDARRVFEKMVFQDTVAWNCLLLGYADSGEAEMALDLFARMISEEKVKPDALTFVAAVRACTALVGKEEGTQIKDGVLKLRALDTGMRIHAEAVISGWDLHVMLANTLVSMYSQCGSLLDSRYVFDRMPQHNLVSWNALMLAYVESGHGESALELYTELDMEPNWQTFVAALKSSGNAVNLRASKAIHAGICRRGGGESEVMVMNSLLDAYGKCGRMLDAEQMFLSLGVKNTVTWNSMLAGFARQGDPDRVFEIFQSMQEEGYEVDGVSLVSVLAACSHAGMVDRGKRLFKKMSSKYTVKPTVEHYICLVDLLGRSNHLQEAVDFANSIQRSNPMIWRTILGACWKWKNVEVARVAYDNLMKLNADDAGTYLLMANIYGSCLVHK